MSKQTSEIDEKKNNAEYVKMKKKTNGRKRRKIEKKMKIENSFVKIVKL